MKWYQFRRAVAALQSIDRDQYPGDDREWDLFRAHPLLGFLLCDGMTAEHLWRLIEPKVYPTGGIDVVRLDRDELRIIVDALQLTRDQRAADQTIRLTPEQLSGLRDKLQRYLGETGAL